MHKIRYRLGNISSGDKIALELLKKSVALKFDELFTKLI